MLIIGTPGPASQNDCRSVLGSASHSSSQPSLAALAIRLFEMLPLTVVEIKLAMVCLTLVINMLWGTQCRGILSKWQELFSIPIWVRMGCPQ